MNIKYYMYRMSGMFANQNITIRLFSKVKVKKLFINFYFKQVCKIFK